VEGLREALGAYAALGVGTIREALISVDELGVYQAAWEAGALSVRARPLIRVPNDVGADAAIDLVEGLGVHSGFGDGWLRVWGLKLVLDGGVEGAPPTSRTPTTRPTGGISTGIPRSCSRCVAAARRGWRIGTHAVGDRAVRVVLDVDERVTNELAAWPRRPWSSSTPSWPTPPSRRGRSGWGWASPCSTPCCGTWPARCSPPGDRSGPPGSARSTSGWPPAQSWPREPTSCARSTP
jgi:Amidohydrolase family